jgi:transposase-like protein
MLADAYGVELSAGTISRVTDKVVQAVQAWQQRLLAAVYPIVYLDAMYLKIRRDGQVKTCAVHIVMGVDMQGHRDILGHWASEGPEGANFWLTVLTDLQQRGVEDIFIAAIDGLSGFADALQAVFPETQVQRCIIHQIRASLKYVTWNDRKAFMKDLKTVYQAPNRDTAETQLSYLADTWGDSYPVALRSWQTHWDDLATFFDYPAEIRRLIYTTNPIESYHRQLRKVTKTKASFPTPQAALKLLYLAQVRIAKKWTRPLSHWPRILNQLAIRFEPRMPL